MIRDYYQLAKPGIIYGNLVTTIAAFLYASAWYVSLPLFLATVAGIALVIGSGCVFNNYTDQALDRKMQRTKDRALAAGRISGPHALAYGAVLGLLGLSLLCRFVNLLTAGIALFGFVMYVGVYAVAKRRSPWGAVVGSIPGAVPIVVGYTAVMDRLDTQALLLFLVLALWQLPHFYAIAIRRQEDYAAAAIPVLPLRYGAHATVWHMLVSIVLFAVAAVGVFAYGVRSYAYLAAVLALSLWWLVVTLAALATPGDSRSARRVFFVSLFVLTGTCVVLALAPLLP